MRVKLIAGLAAFVIASPAMAMDVSAFLTKADSLQRKGPFALFSGDYKLLMGQIKADAQALKADREAAKAAGRTAAYCPPGPIKMSAGDIMTAMRQVPVAERARTDTRSALRAYFARRFPCR